MASFKQYTASGGASEAFSIPTFSSDEIKVYVDNVLKTAATHYNITSYTTNGGTVEWTSGNIPSSGTVRIVRDTDVLTARATYAAGSSIKALVILSAFILAVVTAASCTSYVCIN